MKIQINNEEIKNACIIDDILYFLYNKQIYSVNDPCKPDISQLNQITKYTFVNLDIINLFAINEIFDEFKYNLFHLLLTKYSDKTKATEFVSATSDGYFITNLDPQLKSL